jgi:hypothetical protein
LSATATSPQSSSTNLLRATDLCGEIHDNSFERDGVELAARACPGAFTPKKHM